MGFSKMQYLGEKVREYAELYPAKTAIEHGSKIVTYSQLEKESNVIANILNYHEHDEKYVFVMVDRSPELVTTLLGVMKAGFVFVPVDINYPHNRIMEMLKAIPASWIITNEYLVDKVDEIAKVYDRRLNVLLMDEEGRDAEHSDQSNSYQKIRMSEQGEVSSEPREDYYNNKHCYVYFTSGSTGEPKAVLGRHRSLLHYINWEIKEFQITDTSRVSQLTRSVFDPFLRDIFVPLCSGGTICIPENNEVLMNQRKLLQWMDESRITLMHMVPSLFKVLSNQLEENMTLGHLEHIFLAGELLRGNDIKRWLTIMKNQVQLINLYGPTETTLAKFFYRINEEDYSKGVIPVGRPITHANAYVLNKDMQKCPTGVSGEVFIRTPFISSGYVNDKALTRQKFIKNPFSDNPHDYIYSTGDIGKKLFDGNFELIGRMDHQIKIRGMRVDAGEIEHVIMKHELIRDGIVVAREDSEGNKDLYAYIVAEDEINTTELKRFLAKDLPQYMVPSYYIQMDKLPLTANGKVNKRALLKIEPAAAYDDISLELPIDEQEEKLLWIWKRIFKSEAIGTNSDFFELGGHSLKVADLVGEIYKDLNIELRIADIFDYPTIKDLSEYIKSTAAVRYEPIPKIEQRDFYDTSYAQKRMFILEQIGMGKTHYNTPKAFKIYGELDVEKIESVINQVVDRHEVLRSIFELIDGEVVQMVKAKRPIALKHMKGKVKELQKVLKAFVRPFDIEKSPLLRVEVVSFDDHEHLLMMDAHHIVTDGVSFGILLEEFFALYNGDKLEALPIQYKDYCHWENVMFNKEVMKRQEDYWMQQYATKAEVLKMPLDYSRPDQRTYIGSSVREYISKEDLNKVKEICNRYGVTLNMGLYSLYILLLHYYTGQTDITCGVIVANRNHPDLKKLIGVFINFLPIRNRIDKSMTLSEFLKVEKETILNGYNNSQYPFEMIVNKVVEDKVQNRNDMFDTMFVFHNQVEHDAHYAIEGLRIEGVEIEKKTTKLDFQLDLALDNDANLVCTIEYDTQLFEENTMKDFLDDFKELVENMADYELNEIQAIKLSNLSQKHQNTVHIIDDFNDDLRDE